MKQKKKKRTERDTVLGTLTNFTNKEYEEFIKNLKKDRTEAMDPPQILISKFYIVINRNNAELETRIYFEDSVGERYKI
jgi:hypothetical protein